MPNEEQAQTDGSAGKHWSEVAASNILKQKPEGKIAIATGITPSGPIHLGNMREVLTGDAVYRSLKELGADCELVYIADTFDPLRKVYPFLPKEYEKYIGMPLYNIPDPEGCHGSYSEHFLEPFLKSLNSLGIVSRVILAHEMYKDGVMQSEIIDVLENKDRVAKIIEETSGRELPAGWWPYHVECDKCGRVSSTNIENFNKKMRLVGYQCNACENTGESDAGSGKGKLSWRLDWPARWKALGIKVEPFGKDHAAAGGSYETGSRIAREIFSYEPPIPQIYEWIYLKGQGAMASSTGLGVSISDLLSAVKPEVVRFLVLRSKPEKHIEFDPGQGLVRLVEEYRDLENRFFDKTADSWARTLYELSQVNGIPESKPQHLPLDHMSIIIQTAGENLHKIRSILSDGGYDISSFDDRALVEEITKARFWLERFAPKNMVIPSPFETAPDYKSLSSEQQDFLVDLAGMMNNINWNAESIHRTIYDTSVAHELSTSQAFKAVYSALINESKGPRAGWFIASLPRELVIDRFKQAKESV